MNSERESPTERRARNVRTLRWGLRAAALAFGFGFALVPFYDVMCEKIFGIKPDLNPAAATSCTGVDLDRLVTVEFETSISADLPWTLDSEKKIVQVHPCEPSKVVFTASNRGVIGMTGQAIFNIAPGRASAHLTKTECFCFTEQHLAVNETRDMPVRFMLDDQLPKDVNTVTFRYVFNLLRVDLAADSVAYHAATGPELTLKSTDPIQGIAHVAHVR